MYPGGVYEQMNVTVFEFESSLNIVWWKAFLDRNWAFSIWSSMAYVAAVFGGRWLMEEKTKFGLNYILALWSGLLAIFSIMGTSRVWPEMLFTFRTGGFHASVCSASWMDHPINQFWTILFVLSKVVELGDTAFIVLRKQPLIFLHWYHHITVLVYTWFSFSERTSSGRWFIAMNYTVHSIMYSYYALRAFRVRVSDAVRMFITLAQLSQMAVGCTVTAYAWNMKRQNIPCAVTDANINCGFLMYLSYLVLFAKFFYDAYISPKARKPKTNDSTKTNGVQNGHVTNGKKMH